MTPSQIAFRAAEIMSERGHCKGRLEDPEGRVCFSGALCAAATNAGRLYGTGGDPWHMLADDFRSISSVTFKAGLILDERGYPEGPVSYNNEEYTSAEDVISLLKITAGRLEEAERA